MKSVLEAHIEKGEFHHGYLLVGDFEVSREMAFEAAKAILLKPIEAHPDFFYQTFKLFGIKDSHDLQQRASLKPFLGNSKVFVIEILSFSIESANALLKTFEEPHEGTYFFMITSSLEDVLPALRSRLMIIDNSKERKEINNERKEFYKKFLADSPARRLELIKNISQDKERAIEFLNELEVVLHKLSDFSILEKIQECRNFLYQKGGSPKMVLEHLALVLP
ncbi:MAG: hypothetical protein HY773_00435 [Candidatus Terrybacteria bacterium]|nr:hypothetical protein [Candidatus Terrybacteria bacterium]MBI4812056.1 hypothetical protein [Candidatus Falkowbacteria bacterium]